MDKTELELLKKVLPEPYELVNNDTSLWEPNMELQLELDSFDTAREVLAKMLAVKSAHAFEDGRSKVRWDVKEALGLNAELRNCVKH